MNEVEGTIQRKMAEINEMQNEMAQSSWKNREMSPVKADGVRISQVHVDQQNVLQYTHAYEKDINDAFNALNCLKKGDLTELKSFANPPALVGRVANLVCLIKGVETSWGSFKKLIANPDHFLDSLQELDYNSIPASTIKKVNKELSNPDFSYESLNK
jgi:dynein heavy chain